MRPAVHVVAVVGVAALIVLWTPIAVVASGGSGTVAIGDHGRDGEAGHSLRFVESDGYWGELPAKQCGPLGFEPLTNVQFGLRLQFPLQALPAGAVVTRATLALHDGSTGGASAIELAGYVGAELIGGDGPPAHTTGAIQVDVAPTTGRRSFDVTSVFSADMLATGWAGFWLRPVAGSSGLHDIDCPRDPLFPILTLKYARDAAATAAPGTLVVGVGAYGGGRQRQGDGDWGDLTASLCGDVGLQVDADLVGTVVLAFPMAGLPGGARITGATLALRDANPGAGGPIEVMVYDPFDPRNELDWDTGAPGAPTGTIVIHPASSDARETWDLGGALTAQTIANGWAGFLLRPADQTDGMHHVSCPGEPFYPILTVQYVQPAGAASPTPRATLPATDATRPLDPTDGGASLLVVIAAMLVGALALGGIERTLLGRR